MASLFTDHGVLQRDRAIPVWGTAPAGTDVSVQLAGKAVTATADAHGTWRAELPAVPAGGPLELVVQGDTSVVLKDILVGEVWLCSGQSNMDFTVARTEKKYFAGTLNEATEIAAADHPRIRMFTADLKMADEPVRELAGDWKVCSPATVGDFSAVAYFFGRDLQKELNVPIGLITIAYGASTAQAWTSRAALQANPELAPMLEAYATACSEYDSGVAKTKFEEALKKWELAAEKAKAEGKNPPRKPAFKDPRQDQHNPAVLYNGMVAPVAPYSFRGAIWYQGESNGYNSQLYLELMKTLIADWRKTFGNDFPFLFVQLAGHKAPSTQPVQGNSQPARVRDAQLATLAIPNTAMATAVDVGDEKDIHPKNKQEVGRRLALAALGTAYGQMIVYSGPIATSATRDGSIVRIKFNHVGGGLVGKTDTLTGFAMAGDDGKFAFANAKIDGDSVIVQSVEVAAPTEVRFGWHDHPQIVLYNKEGLPASPFKLMVSEPAK